MLVEAFSSANGFLSRRDCLKVGGVAALTATGLAGCSQSDDDSPDADNPTNGADDAGALEAPSLAERVGAGDLPLLDERLPLEPVVVDPVERVGVYGGEWRTAVLGASNFNSLGQMVGYEPLLRFDFDDGQLYPNIAASFEVNADGTEFVVGLREGLKWSDGEPFTADDIVFMVEDVYLNEELNPVPPFFLVGAGQVASVEKMDDYTVRFAFPAPNGIFVHQLATHAGRDRSTGLIGPRHYLSQFHPDYADNVDQLVSEAGVRDWVELFTQKNTWWTNADRPTLNPWMVTTGMTGTDAQVVVERNPYYWKVDPDGKQLPYIDTVSFDVNLDEEGMLLKAVSGEYDFHGRNFTTLQNKPVLAESRESGNYDFFDVIPEEHCDSVICLNLTHQDPVKREVFNTKDFRIGLSHAINRQEIIDTVYQGEGEPYQGAPRPESEFYDEEFATMYTAYDVELAEQHLDNVLPDKDSEGFRLGPDGNRFSFTVDVSTSPRPTQADVMELVSGYWRDVGVDVRVEVEDRSLYEERVGGNQHDAGIWSGDGGGADIVQRPRYFVPTGGVGRIDYAIAWSAWYTGEGGEEPPDRIKGYIELYDRAKATSDENERVDLVRQVIASAKDEFYVIGISLTTNEYGIVKNNLHNVRDPLFHSNLAPRPGNAEPSHWFFEG